MKNKKIRKTVIVICWLVIWQILAVVVDNSILVVGPWEAAGALWHSLGNTDFWHIVGLSLLRIGSGFLGAFVAGVLLGSLSFRIPVLEEILAPVTAVCKTVPVASFVVLLLIWAGSEYVAVVICFLVTFPNIYFSVMAGLRSAPKDLLEMAWVFRTGRFKKICQIYRPAVEPYLENSLKVTLGMSWKSGVAAEVIGIPAFSLGERLYTAKIYLDTASLFAWTFVIILLSFLFEKVFLFLFHKIAGTEGLIRGITSSGQEKKDKTTPEWKEDQSGQAITISQLSKKFGDQQVFKDLTRELKKGDTYCIMGPSGAGKTTLLRILAGLDTAEEGNITGLKKGTTGFAFQEDRLLENLSAVENVQFAAGVNRAYALAELEQVINRDSLEKKAAELSGGMKRRVSVVRAMAAGGELVVLDEPFAGLDRTNKVILAEYIRSRQRARTLLVTTHDESDLELLQGIRWDIQGKKTGIL